MNNKTKLALLCAASVLALAPAAFAQQQADAGAETVVVTGSRVITDATMSPTPLTIVSTETLQATTPTSLPDALNKLPVFEGSTTPRGTNNASVNSAGNVLNLRNFGASRTLILMDGHRVAASNSNGTVDVDAIPQMLIQRVDVVTGGASAVYGSDAVTGVVNFVLDKRFNGVKVDTSSGISTYGDGASYNIGIAAGTDLFGGRGHIEVALRRFYQDGVLHNDRPEGQYDWLLTGSGTAAAPFVNTPFARLSRYGSIISCAGCAANGMRFNESGGISPYNLGTPTKTSGVSSGGDGGYTSIAQVTSSLGTHEAFGRFSYNLDDSTSFYVQASGAESYTKGSFQNHAFQTGAVPNTFLKSNPYLPAGDAAQLAGSTQTLTVSGYFDLGYPRSGYQSNGLQRNLNVTTGMDGTLFGDKYDWSVYYTHGEGRLHEDDPTNLNYQRMYAAVDGVAGAAGTVSCYATTAAAGAAANAAYAGCVPINPFGANSVGMNQVTKAMNDYISGDTSWWLTNTVDNVGGSIAGDIFDLPAGPVKAALSGEARWVSMTIESNASPTATVDCTGLRTTAPGAAANSLCNVATPLWQNNTLAALPTVSNSVWEFAGEANVPLLKDVPLVQSLAVDLAGRYTDYSTSGAVQTWKIGVNWHISDDFSIRGTNSIDIRAPTLNDLFAPVGQGIQSFTDSLHPVDPVTGVHVSQTGQNFAVSQGNTNLVPEVARTYTGGVVFTPTFLPGFTASVDYYTIVLKNAIAGQSGGSTALQQICEDSNGTSPYCSLLVRPLPFSDRTAANFPTKVLSTPINAAFNKLEGVDFEVNYNFSMASLWDVLPGEMSLRGLASYTPVNESIQFTGGPLGFSAYPSGKFSLFAKYTLGNWAFNLQDRWISGFGRAGSFTNQIYADPRVPSINYIDLNIDKKFHIDDVTMDGFISMQNVFDQRPHVNPTNNTNPGLYFMGVQGATTSLYDAIGRYFTVGVKARL